MERRTKIIRYVLVVLAALAALIGGTLTAPAAVATGTVDRGLPRAKGAEIFSGLGFDTCETPPLGVMSAWRASPYGAVGVYFGGRARACKQQPNLGRHWVRGVHDMGWRIIPIYVGSQSPCVDSDAKRPFTIGDRPWAQGRAEGRDAVERAAVLGMRQGSALYFDMEAYDIDDEECADITLSFVRGWSYEVRRQGYIPGFYSSATSGVQHMEMARLDGAPDLPSVMWFARWHVAPSLYGEPMLAPNAWAPHRRIHQYLPNVTERYGGMRIKIDRNLVDAPVAVVG